MTTLQVLKDRVLADYPEANVERLGDMNDALATLPLEYRDQQ